MKDNLIKGEFWSEYPDYGFKIKNLTEKEQLKLYEEINILKKENKNKSCIYDEILFEMFKKLVICEGKIKFQDMSFEEFQKILNAEYVSQTFIDLKNDISLLILKCNQNGLNQKRIEIETLKLQLIFNAIEKGFTEYVDIANDLSKQIKMIEDRERINKLKTKPNWDDINKVSWLSRKLETIKINKEIKKNKKKGK